MKILDTCVLTYPTPVVGRICDRCGHRVELSKGSPPPYDRTDVSIGAELSRFVSIDLNQNSKLYRADLCRSCGEVLLEMLRPMMASMRKIAEPNENGVRIFNYQAVYAADGERFSISSIIDDGA